MQHFRNTAVVESAVNSGPPNHFRKDTLYHGTVTYRWHETKQKCHIDTNIINLCRYGIPFSQLQIFSDILPQWAETHSAPAAPAHQTRL